MKLTHFIGDESRVEIIRTEPRTHGIEIIMRQVNGTIILCVAGRDEIPPLIIPPQKKI